MRGALRRLSQRASDRLGLGQLPRTAEQHIGRQPVAVERKYVVVDMLVVADRPAIVGRLVVVDRFAVADTFEVVGTRLEVADMRFEVVGMCFEAVDIRLETAAGRIALARVEGFDTLPRELAQEQVQRVELVRVHNSREDIPPTVGRNDRQSSQEESRSARYCIPRAFVKPQLVGQR